MTEEQTAEAPAVVVTYKDDDLVYVDPDARSVVGFVEFAANGKPKPLAMKQEVVEEEEGGAEGKDKDKRRKPRRQRYYPWGTYRSMKRVYKIEGKQLKVESQKTLDEVMEKALNEPFWD